MPSPPPTTLRRDFEEISSHDLQQTLRHLNDILKDLCNALFRSTVGDDVVQNRQPLSTKGEMVEIRPNSDPFEATAPPDRRIRRYNQ